MSLAEIEALIAEKGDRKDMPADYKRRLLAVMQKDHVRTVRFINELHHDIERTIKYGDLEQAATKQAVLARSRSLEAEFRALLGKLAVEIQETAFLPSVASPRRRRRLVGSKCA